MHCECWIPFHCDATIEWERSGKVRNPGCLKALWRNRESNHMRALVAADTSSGRFRVWGPEARVERGPLMTSSYSANRDKHFWSSLGYGHSRICSLHHRMTDIAEGENAKGCSWYTTLKRLKVGKTRLAKHKS